MTRYGWDASNHDWPRGPMDLARARREGIALFTHKASEGSTFTDPYFEEAMDRARSVGFPVVGAYHVLWPNNPVEQADYFLSVVERFAPWWRDHPCFIFQTDAELFDEFVPHRKPNLAEIRAFNARVRDRAGVPAARIPTYAPQWLYNDELRGLGFPLWASNYGDDRPGQFTDTYPGDTDQRWGAYSGQTPIVLQYRSKATIAGQAPADANAIRVNSDAALQALFLGDDDDMPTAEEIADAVWHRRMQGNLTAQYQADQLLTDIRDIIGQVRDNAATAAAHSVAADTQTDQLAARFDAQRTQIVADVTGLITAGGTPAAVAEAVADLIAQRLGGTPA